MWGLFYMPSKLEFCHFSSSVQPNFDNQPYTTTYGWHGYMNITCVANGEPEPVIDWYKKESGQEITSQTSFYNVIRSTGEKQTTSTLMVSKPTCFVGPVCNINPLHQLVPIQYMTC